MRPHDHRKLHHCAVLLAAAARPAEEGKPDVPSSTSHPKEVLDEVKLFCSSASRTPSSKRLEPPRKP
jgi:hypothetical protein